MSPRVSPVSTPARWRLWAPWVIAAPLLLTGCEALVLGSVISSALSANDRRSTGAQVEDQGIEFKAASRLSAALEGRGHVNVTSYNRAVLLTGEVPSEADRTLAEHTVAGIDNVRTVVNELAVMGVSALPSRSADAIVSSKVKAAFIDSPQLHAQTLKVVTERGNVYLMGRVSAQEAELAVERARSVRGVLKVVQVFELLTDAEFQRLGRPPAPSSAP